MSNRLPVEVNPFRLIEQRRQLLGTVQATQLPRLQALAVPAEESVDFVVTLEFAHSLSQLPMISGRVSGSVALECQRCLEAVVVEVDAPVNVVVTASQTDRQPEEQGYEMCIIENDRLFLQDFIEDEILLALPVVPRHEACQPVRPLWEASPDEVADTEQTEQEGKDNPFAVLKDLKDWKKTE